MEDIKWLIARPVVVAAARVVLSAMLAALMAVPALVEFLPPAVAACLAERVPFASKSSLERLTAWPVPTSPPLV